MLILSRKRGEQIVISEGLITITVVQIRGDKVRIGIDAPDSVRVDRREVHEAIQRDGRSNERKSPEETGQSKGTAAQGEEHDVQSAT